MVTFLVHLIIIQLLRLIIASRQLMNSQTMKNNRHQAINITVAAAVVIVVLTVILLTQNHQALQLMEMVNIRMETLTQIITMLLVQLVLTYCLHLN